MNIPFLDLKRQEERLREELEKVLCEVLRSTKYIGGPYVERFEHQISDYLGCGFATGCGNGTDALVLALRACGIGPGDEVITSPFTFFATAEAISSIGAVPVFVDIREDTFNLDEGRIEEAISVHTKAIIPIHIFGAACEMDKIMETAKRHNLKVIEDAAQAIGGEYKGQKLGTIGDAGCFSFYPTKNLGAAGDGGMVVTESEETAITIRALREHGAGENGARTFSTWYHSEEQMSPVAREAGLFNPQKYYNYLIGYNSRLDAMQAAVLSVKLKYIDDFNLARKRIAELYCDNLSSEYGLPIHPKLCGSSWHQFAIRTKDKPGLCHYMEENGIGCGSFYPVPLHRQKAYMKNLMKVSGDSLPVADQAAKETVCLPIWPEMTEAEVFQVIECVNKFCCM